MFTAFNSLSLDQKLDHVLLCDWAHYNVFFASAINKESSKQAGLNFNVVVHPIKWGQVLTVERTEILTRTEVRTCEIVGTECRPSARTEHLRFVQVVHVNGNTEDAGQRDEIRADVAVAHHAVVRAPVVHHRVNIAEGALVREAWNEPSRRPGRIRALLESFVSFWRQLHRLAFGDLEGGSNALDKVESENRRRHSATGDVACAPATAWEILGDRRVPRCRLQAGFHFSWGDIPEWLHGWLAVDGLFAAAIEGRWAGIDEVQEAVCGRSLRGFA